MNQIDHKGCLTTVRYLLRFCVAPNYFAHHIFYLWKQFPKVKANTSNHVFGRFELFELIVSDAGDLVTNLSIETRLALAIPSRMQSCPIRAPWALWYYQYTPWSLSRACPWAASHLVTASGTYRITSFVESSLISSRQCWWSTKCQAAGRACSGKSGMSAVHTRAPAGASWKRYYRGCLHRSASSLRPAHRL